MSFWDEFKDILELNPKIKSHASLVPTSRTKEQRKYWKRNVEKNCNVSDENYTVLIKVIAKYEIEFPRVAMMNW